MSVEVYLGEHTITLDVEDHFNIDEDNVDGGLCRAGTLLRFYGELAAEFMAQASRAKDDKERMFAKVSLDTRAKLAESKEKVTEGIIRETVLISTEYIESQEKHIQAERDYKKLDSFFRSQQRKVDCLTALAYKQRVEIQKNAF